MNKLSEQHCQPCEGGVEPLTLTQAQQQLGQLTDGWRLSDDGKSLHHDYVFKNFYHTMSFVNAIAHIANREDHHPDLAVGYNYCKITFTTHAIQGLSENDFICAAKIDSLVAQS